MRWAVLFTLCLLYPLTSEGAISFPSTCSAEEDNADAVITCMVTVQTGDRLVCLAYSATNTSATVTCTDSASSSYSAAAYRDTGNGSLGFSCATAAGAASPTVTATFGANDYKFIVVLVMRGAASCTPSNMDTFASGSSTSAATNSISTPAGALIGVVQIIGDTTITATNGATQQEESEVNDAAGSWGVSTEVTSGGSQTATWTLGTSRDWEATGYHFDEEVTSTRRTLMTLGM